MSYPRIISKLTREPWCVTERVHQAMLSAIESKLAGANVSAMEIPEDDDDDANEPYTVKSVAVIPMKGIMGKGLSALEMECGGCSMEEVAKALKLAAEDDGTSAIILEINTPGGTVNGTPELANLVADIATRKPVFAYTETQCCSAGLWVASQATHFYASQSADVGSCGVRMVMLDYSRQLDREGVTVNAISSGKYKLMGAEFKPLEKDEREMLQADSDQIHAQFKDAVTRNRAVDEKHLQGQSFDGSTAAEIGMIDGVIDDFDEVLEMALQTGF